MEPSAGFGELCAYAAWGGAGALIASMTRTRRLQLPRLYLRRSRDGETVRILDPGFLAAPLLGAFLAAALDGRPWTAAAYGLASGWAGPAILNALIDPILHRVLGRWPREPEEEGEKE